MLKKLSEVSPSLPLGSTTGHKLFRVTGGLYAGRLAALYSNGSNSIELVWSESPYQAWSAPQVLISDSGDVLFEAHMDPQGNLTLVYTDSATLNLVCRPITLTASGWSVGSKTAVYNGAQGMDPSLASSSDGKLWVSWRSIVLPSSWIHVKSSADNGATWGTGSADPGDQIAGPSTMIWSKLVMGAGEIFAIIAKGSEAIVVRSLPLGGSVWSAETVVYTGNGVGGEFDAALTDSGGLAVVFCDPLPKYRESDGFIWGAVQQLDSQPAFSPQLQFRNNQPVIAFLSVLGTNQNALRYTARLSGSFQTPSFVDRQARPFDRVFLYREASSTFQDVTSVASDTSTADVYHPQSGALLSAVGDRLYVGLDDRFRFLTIILSTAGAGGSVSFSYWDGSGWASFVPSGGPINLTALANQIMLWPDYQTIPQNWQKCSVNSDRKCWLRVEVTSSFATLPVGSMVTAMSDLRQIITRR